MPVSEYETFEYRLFEDAPLSLEDAIKKADQLRGADATRFHRVVPTDSNMVLFHVDSVSREHLYAELLSRWSNMLNRFVVKSVQL